MLKCLIVVVLVRQLGRPRLRWEEEIQMDLSKIGCEGLFVFVGLAQFSVWQWAGLLLTFKTI